MIWEIWQYLKTPTALDYVTPMGFLKESIAMAARAKRCQSTWQTHYQACQDSILEAAALCPQKRTVLIFGAGSLQDVPLQTLSDQFQQVWLVDLLFLPAARSAAEPYSNVQLIEHDVTESLAEIFNGNQNITAPKHWVDHPHIDLVVSLNMMTQLPLLPVKWLQSRHQCSDSQIDELGQKLMESHLQYLQEIKMKNEAVVCLIADRWVRRLDRDGQLIKEFDPWWEVDKPEAQEEWDWQVMPLGEASRHYSQVHRVGVSFL